MIAEVGTSCTACPDRHYAAGLARGRGSDLAVCGVTVLPASLCTVPGRPCLACAGVPEVDDDRV